LLDRVQGWLGRTAVAPGHHAVIGTFDVATGRPLRAVGIRNGRAAYLQPFTADSRSFRTMTLPAGGTGPVWFERWAVEAPGPPWWLIGLTAGAVGLAVADRTRSRRKGA
jgi:hypothetical protein